MSIANRSFACRVGRRSMFRVRLRTALPNIAIGANNSFVLLQNNVEHRQVVRRHTYQHEKSETVRHLAEVSAGNY
jgi:hypothetical protein